MLCLSGFELYSRWVPLKLKGTAPKVLWEKDKELKSDPRSCALVWAPC